MAKAIFKAPFSENNLYLNGYILRYDTGETEVVNRPMGGVITQVEVPVVKGGYCIGQFLEGEDEGKVRVQIETSEAVMSQIKADPNYIWIEDVLEE